MPRLHVALAVAMLGSLAILAGTAARPATALAQAVISAPGAPQSPTSLGGTQNTSGVRTLTSLPPPAAVAPPAVVPGAPAAIGTTTALPQLAPAPKVVASAPAAQPQTFRCSCFGVGTGTRWIGTVAAPSFTQADQAAQGQCVNYLLTANEPSPYLPLSGAAFTTRSPYPNVNPNIALGSVVTRTSVTSQTQVSAATLGSLTVANYCSRCACN